MRYEIPDEAAVCVHRRHEVTVRVGSVCAFDVISAGYLFGPEEMRVRVWCVGVSVGVLVR
jgi:hypothetical protein